MSCIKCDEFLQSWKADLLSGKKPVFYYTGIPLGLSAGRLVVIGSPLVGARPPFVIRSGSMPFVIRKTYGLNRYVEMSHRRYYWRGS